MGVEVLTPEVPVIHFKSDGIPPPSDLYVTRDDALFITSYNITGGLRIGIRYTILRPDGILVPGSLDNHIPNTNRTAATSRMALGQGFLLSASVFLEAGSAKRGQCFVQVGIARGVTSAQFIHRIIMQGYVGTAVNLTWPGNRLEQPTEGPGNIRVIAGTDPAAGVEITETVPTGARWSLRALYATLVASGVAGNRRPFLYLDDGTTIFSFSPAPGVIAASATGIFTWAVGMPHETVLVGGNPVAGIPSPLFLAAGYRFRTSTVSIDAGDNYAAPQYIVEEWIEP